MFLQISSRKRNKRPLPNTTEGWDEGGVMRNDTRGRRKALLVIANV